MESLSKILCSLDDAVWSYDLKQQEFIYVNERLADLYETSVDELRSRSGFWLQNIHPQDCDFVNAQTEAAFAGAPTNIEYRLVINGKVKWVQDRKIIIPSCDGTSHIITGMLSDITQKKITELSFSNSEKTFRYLFINNPNPLWIYDVKTLKFLAINHAAIMKYGYSEKEFLSMTIADIRPAEDLGPLLDNVKEVIGKQYHTGKRWRHLKKGGEIIYVDISGHRIKFKGKDAQIVMAHDITPEVESHRKVALAKKNLDALINNIGEEIWSIDANYNIISYNTPFNDTIKSLIGREVVLGECIFMPEFAEHEKNFWRKNYERALVGEQFSFTARVLMPCGKRAFMETRMNPIRDGFEIIGVACLSRNIQDRLETQKKIIEHNQRLLELISLTSHELRGPAASLLGLSQVFNRDNYSDPFNAEIIEHIQLLTEQLDCVIHTLVEKTYSLQQQNAPTYAFQHNQSGNELL